MFLAYIYKIIKILWYPMPRSKWWRSTLPPASWWRSKPGCQRSARESQEQHALARDVMLVYLPFSIRQRDVTPHRGRSSVAELPRFAIIYSWDWARLFATVPHPTKTEQRDRYDVQGSVRRWPGFQRGLVDKRSSEDVSWIKGGERGMEWGGGEGEGGEWSNWLEGKSLAQ